MEVINQESTVFSTMCILVYRHIFRSLQKNRTSDRIVLITIDFDASISMSLIGMLKSDLIVRDEKNEEDGLTDALNQISLNDDDIEMTDGAVSISSLMRVR